MEIPRHDEPEFGWLLVGAVVIVADVTGRRTMSDAFRTASRHPVAGPALALGWGTLTAHLFGLIRPRFDPFHRLACWKCPHG